MQGISDDDRAMIADAIAAREESLRFFSNASKPEREVWVVIEFLTNRGIAFDVSEVIPVSEDPPDVVFRDARFEIKEIMDQGRRRSDELKLDLERARSATSASELFELGMPRDVTYSDACGFVEKQLEQLSIKYAPSTRDNLDLLFYVNLQDVYGYVPSATPPPAYWDRYGFRSVSIVLGRMGIVLTATAGAPAFLHGARIVAKPRPWEE